MLNPIGTGSTAVTPNIFFYNYHSFFSVWDIMNFLSHFPLMELLTFTFFSDYFIC